MGEPIQTCLIVAEHPKAPTVDLSNPLTMFQACLFRPFLGAKEAYIYPGCSSFFRLTSAFILITARFFPFLTQVEYITFF